MPPLLRSPLPASLNPVASARRNSIAQAMMNIARPRPQIGLPQLQAPGAPPAPMPGAPPPTAPLPNAPPAPNLGQTMGQPMPNPMAAAMAGAFNDDQNSMIAQPMPNPMVGANMPPPGQPPQVY